MKFYWKLSRLEKNKNIHENMNQPYIYELLTQRFYIEKFPNFIFIRLGNIAVSVVGIISGIIIEYYWIVCHIIEFASHNNSRQQCAKKS